MHSPVACRVLGSLWFGSSMRLGESLERQKMLFATYYMQKHFAIISTLAFSRLLADLGSIVSPVSGCNCGSFSTSIHISVSHFCILP